MPELITPADVEQAVIDALGANVETGIPDSKPAEFTRVVAGGGTQRNAVTDTWVVTVEAFARTETLAAKRASAHVATLQAAGRAGQLGSVTCYGVSVVSLPANLPMPSVPTHRRYITTVTVDLRRVTY